MGDSDDEGVAFRSEALDVVESWVLEENGEQSQEKEHQQIPVALYRPNSASSGKSLPSLTRPNTANMDAALTEQERKMKRKILRKSCAGGIEEALKAERDARLQCEEAQDEEEQELVRLKAQTSKDDRKRKRTTQEKLLDRLRKEAAKKKDKNLKRKLQLQRKKQQQKKEVAIMQKIDRTFVSVRR